MRRLQSLHARLPGRGLHRHGRGRQRQGLHELDPGPAQPLQPQGGRVRNRRMNVKNLKVNGDRLWDSLMEMAKIGPGVAGGNCRLALSDFDREGRDLFVRWCKEAGCAIAVDRMGNIRSEEHTSELQSLMRISYAVFCLKKKKTINKQN